MGYSAKYVNHLVQGNAVLTEDAALRLELVLGASADFWLTREARYRGRVARLKAARFHAEYVRWLDELPVKFPMTAGTANAPENTIPGSRTGVTGAGRPSSPLPLSCVTSCRRL